MSKKLNGFQMFRYSNISNKNLIIIFSLLLYTSSSKIFAQKKYISDLEYIRTQLPDKHIHLYKKISKYDFGNKINSIEKNLEDSNPNKFLISLYELCSYIGDAHTTIYPKYDSSFPIRFSKFKEGYFVTEIDNRHKDLLNKKLNSINNQSIEQIITGVKSISETNNKPFLVYNTEHCLYNPYILNGLKIIPNTEHCNYGLDSEDISIDALSSKNNILTTDTILLSEKYRNLNYAYKAIGDSVIYFAYNVCEEDGILPFKDFNTKLFSELDNPKIKKLIIDLRCNGGGNSAVLNPFILQLYHHKLNNKGHFFVLIGNSTFSSALMNAIQFKRYFNAITIGQTTSANINAYGNIKYLELPYSKIRLSYSTKYFNNWKGKKGPLVPDISIDYSIKNRINHIDEAILKAINY